MEKIILWGSGNIGNKAYEKLKDNYEIVAFGDNDIYKQGLTYKGIPVIGLNEVVKKYKNSKIVVSLADYYSEAKKMSDMSLLVKGYYDNVQEKILPWQKIKWEDLKAKENVRLYAGDIYNNFEYYPDNLVICLSLINSNYRCIQHDITKPYPIESDVIDSYQIEDVIEHIDINNVVSVLNEIYRVLKKGGYLRLSLPDYHSPFVLYNSFINKEGNVFFDPRGGGKYVEGKVSEGGHVWFPTYEIMQDLLKQSYFSKFNFFRYHNFLGELYTKEIDYAKGYISRTKEHSEYKKDISIVVDCYK